MSEWTGDPCDDPGLLEQRQEAEYRQSLREQEAQYEYEQAYWYAWECFCWRLGLTPVNDTTPDEPI